MKRWSEYTEKEIVESNSKCITCRYGQRLCSNVNISKDNLYCSYIIVNNKRRGCSPMNCTKYDEISAKYPRYEMKRFKDA